MNRRRNAVMLLLAVILEWEIIIAVCVAIALVFFVARRLEIEYTTQAPQRATVTIQED